MKLVKRTLFVLIACSALLLSCSFAEQVQDANNNTNGSGTAAAGISSNNAKKPKIVFESKILDFGKIGPQIKVTGEFSFRNAGNAVLEISGVHQCCGIVTTLENEKSKYEPGEKGVIKVSYTSSPKPGLFTREPIVYSNDPIEPNVVLTVSAEIVNKVSAKPDKLKLFLDEKNAKCPKLTIASIDNQPFSIRGIKSTGDCITAAFDPNTKANSFVLDLKVDMAKLEHNMKGDLDVVITHPEMNLVSVPFEVLSKYTLNPPLIIALNAKPGERILRKVWVFNNYNQEFEIGSITSKNNYIKVLNQDKVENGYQFELQITPPPVPEGKNGFSDELDIQIKNGEKLKIGCNGYYAIPQTSGNSNTNK